MVKRLTVDEALLMRLRGQRLSSTQVAEKDVAAAVARQVVGLQAQDLFAATLGVRVRAPGSALEEVLRSRLTGRTVVWTWLMRGTLHVVPSEDLGWLLDVLGPPLIAATARRRAQLGLDEATYSSGLRVVRERLAKEGPATREEIGRVLMESGLPHGYAVERHLLYRAALEGVVCMGPDRGDAPGTHPTFVLVADWLGGFRAETAGAAPQATTALAERYLAAFAPATVTDLSAWSGLNVRDLREGWEALASRLAEVEVAGRPMWLPATRLGELDLAPPVSPHVRLLPAFDTYLLGYHTRLPIDENGAYAARISGGGMLPATVLVDGRLRGTWQTNRKGRRVAIQVDPFEPLAPGVDAQIAQEIADIERFLS